MQYDIIGDIHGQAAKLEALLPALGYTLADGTYRHPTRQVVFVGDFIDRGPQGVEVVHIVRTMVEAGTAQAIMGNHELNAIAWHTPDPRKPNEFLRVRKEEPWGKTNKQQHQAFLNQVENDAPLHEEIIDWFLTLPLWLDLPEIRVVHACWHQRNIDYLKTKLHNGRYLTRALMVDATDEPADKAEKDDASLSIFKAVESLTKGIELQLPPSISFDDKDGITRRRVRARWWDAQATTYRAIANMAQEQRDALPDVEIPAHAQLAYDNTKPVFFGHYWMTGAPVLQSPHAAYVDYSAGKEGPLVAYRWSGEPELSVENFFWVK